MSDTIFEPVSVDEQDLTKQREFEEYLEYLREGICVGLGIPMSVLDQFRMEFGIQNDLATEEIVEKSED